MTDKPSRGGRRIPGPGKSIGRPRQSPSGERGRDVLLYMTPTQEQAVREFLERYKQAEQEAKEQPQD